MNTFKRTSVCAAVLAGLGAVGAVGTAEAVFVNPDGTGQVLIYPYYSVRGAKGSATAYYDTLMTVVNSTTQSKVVKVRFMEGRRSQEVLDFNLFLSPNDAWVGAVTRTANGARIVTGDRSCTAPAGIFANVGNVTDQSTPNVFKNYAYTGTFGAGALGNPYSGADGSVGDLDRAREGHFEVVEMAVITEAGLVTAITHNSAGTPANCTVAVNQSVNTFTGATGAAGTFSTALAAPNGGLFGGATLINVLAGTDYSYDAIALEQFNGNMAPAFQYVIPGYPTPNLSTGGNIGTVAATSVVLAKGTSATDPAIVRDTWNLTPAVVPGVAAYAAPNLVNASLSSLNAVATVLQHDTLLNEYIVDNTTNSATDWIVTFPTKGLSMGVGALASVNYIAPFGNAYVNSGVGSCEPISLAFFDREEQFIAPVAGVSPLPVAATNNLCWETNVISFGAAPQIALGTLSGSALSISAIPLPTTQVAGWASITLTPRTAAGLQNLNATAPFISNVAALAAGASVTSLGTTAGQNHRGLPVVGFSMQDFSGGVGAVSNYGGGYKHKTSTLIN